MECEHPKIMKPESDYLEYPDLPLKHKYSHRGQCEEVPAEMVASVYVYPDETGPYIKCIEISAYTHSPGTISVTDEEIEDEPFTGFLRTLRVTADVVADVPAVSPRSRGCCG